MSEFPEKKTTENTAEESSSQPVTIEEESTIFSNPTEHNDKVEKSGKKRLIAIIASLCAVAILVGGTLAIVKLIPEKEDETQSSSSSVFEEIELVAVDVSAISSVNIKNSNGEFNFYTEELVTDEETGETTVVWRVQDIEASKLSDTKTNEIVSAAASIVAKREIDTKTASECGFDNPRYTVTVNSEKYEGFTIYVGDVSPDGLGSYLMLSTDDRIYVVDDSIVNKFDFDLLSLADTSSLAPVTFSTDTSDKVDSNGNYIYFDHLTFSGKNFPETVTLINNPDDSESAALIPYIVTTPSRRYANAENLSEPMSMFTEAIDVAGVYAYEVNASTLKEFGLDNPDAEVRLTIDGETVFFKIAKVDDNYCAVIRHDSEMIYKTSQLKFPVLECKTEDLYSSWVSMNSINEIDKFMVNVGDTVYDFDIDTTVNEDDTKTYKITLNGKTITTKYFQTFYQGFVGLDCIDFNVTAPTAQESASFNFVFTDGRQSTISFYKATETKYQYRIDGMDMGMVASSSYNKIIKNLALLAEDKQPIS